jgi:hypothetical protein
MRLGNGKGEAMKRYLKALCASCIVAGAVAAPVFACGDGPWMGENLVATPGVKAALRSAYVRAHPRVSVAGPVPGRTYYGSYSGTRYAVATFGAYPAIFQTDARNRWRVIRETHGGICTDVVPSELIQVWSLQRWNARCYVEPR